MRIGEQSIGGRAGLRRTILRLAPSDRSLANQVGVEHCRLGRPVFDLAVVGNAHTTALTNMPATTAKVANTIFPGQRTVTTFAENLNQLKW